MCKISELLAASLSSSEHDYLKQIANYSAGLDTIDLHFCGALTDLRLIEVDSKRNYPSLTALGRSVLMDKAMIELP